MMNMHCIYWKESTQLNLEKKIQNRTKPDLFTAFLELIVGKKNGVTERSSDFATIIRKFVLSA